MYMYTYVTCGRFVPVAISSTWPFLPCGRYFLWPFIPCGPFFLWPFLPVAVCLVAVCSCIHLLCRLARRALAGVPPYTFSG